VSKTIQQARLMRLAHTSLTVEPEYDKHPCNADYI